ncbi:MAG TPA: LysM peptidoglycan-binding domain-containing protein [Steroidobacteraceae bacterium]
MVFNQSLGFGRSLLLIAGTAAALLLGACSHFHSAAPEAEAPVTSTTTVAEAAPAEQQTVTDNLPPLPETAAAPVETGTGTSTVIADAGPNLASTAPKSYVVQRGDTLWGIAGMFLKDPWLWPEFWYLNPDIKNPHRIYPGDTLRLALSSDGKTQIQLTPGAAANAATMGGPVTRLEPLLRSSPMNGPIATIPYATIAAFLSRPGLLSRDEVKRAAYVFSLRDEHKMAALGNQVYVKNLQGGLAERYAVMHVGQQLKDPDSGHVLGYMAVYCGSGEITRTGNPATVLMTNSEQETITGDVLVPDITPARADFQPHAPSRPVKGQILAVVNGVLRVGQYQIVAINRGTHDGLEPGHVLRVFDSGATENDDECARIDGFGTCVHYFSQKLPSESAGTLLVFKTYDRLSYALLINETSPVHTLDLVTNP